MTPDRSVTVIRHPNAASFLDAAQAWLMRAEAEHNLILSIALELGRESNSTAPRPPWFVTTEEHGEVVGAALRTPPFKLIIGRTSAEVAMAIAHDAFVVDPELPAVIGPEPAAGAFARAWSELSGRPARKGMRQRILAIETLDASPPRVPGALRPMDDAEQALVTEWFAAFLVEAFGKAGDAAALVRRFTESRSLFVWDDDGPVSTVSYGGHTPNGVRVSFVYTPPALRRLGYAGAAVTALTRQLLDRGHTFCCLYTDLANPTSNRLYEAMGYRPITDVNDYVLSGEPPGPVG